MARYHSVMHRQKVIHHGFRYFLKNISIAVGLVLIWRGIWYVLDAFDFLFLAGNHLWSGLVGIALGILILYIPDKDLKELEKL